MHLKKVFFISIRWECYCYFPTQLWGVNCVKFNVHISNMSIASNMPSCIHNMSSCVHNMPSCIHNMSSCMHAQLAIMDPICHHEWTTCGHACTTCHHACTICHHAFTTCPTPACSSSCMHNMLSSIRNMSNSSMYSKYTIW